MTTPIRVGITVTRRLPRVASIDVHSECVEPGVRRVAADGSAAATRLLTP